MSFSSSYSNTSAILPQIQLPHQTVSAMFTAQFCTTSSGNLLFQ